MRTAIAPEATFSVVEGLMVAMETLLQLYALFGEKVFWQSLVVTTEGVRRESIIILIVVVLIVVIFLW
jgi:hypothetical protein